MNPAIPKNPLFVLFGRAVRELRTAVGLSSTDLARGIDISDSAYRLIESGGAVLQPIHTPQLIKALPSLVWHRILSFLVVAQIADAIFSRGSTAFWNEAIRVANLEKDLRGLIENVRHVWEDGKQLNIDDDTDSSKAAIDAVRKYLEASSSLPRGARTSADTVQAWMDYAPNDVSPIQLNLIQQQIQSWKYFPPSVPPNRFAQWESDHDDSITELYAFVFKLGDIARNAKEYRWDYLKRGTFSAIHFLTPHGQNLETERRLLLDQIAATQSQSDKVRRLIVQKVRIKELEDGMVERLKSILIYDPDHGHLVPEGEPKPDKHVRLENVWLYFMKPPDMTIGFAHNSEGRNDFVSIALTKGEVSVLIPIRRQPWK